MIDDYPLRIVAVNSVIPGRTEGKVVDEQLGWLDRTLAERPDGAPTVLLAHDPALFPSAAARGVDLTLSGHTHGGQLGVPFFARRLNLARVMTRFPSGFYREGASTLFVNHGLGTTGVPIRLLVAPEIAVLTLRRA